MVLDEVDGCSVDAVQWEKQLTQDKGTVWNIPVPDRGVFLLYAWSTVKYCISRLKTWHGAKVSMQRL